jgi:hypothetical protein
MRILSSWRFGSIGVGGGCKHSPEHIPPKNKSDGVTSGDLGGLTVGPPLEIHLPGKLFCCI